MSSDEVRDKTATNTYFSSEMSQIVAVEKSDILFYSVIRKKKISLWLKKEKGFPFK